MGVATKRLMKVDCIGRVTKAVSTSQIWLRVYDANLYESRIMISCRTFESTNCSFAV